MSQSEIKTFLTYEQANEMKGQWASFSARLDSNWDLYWSSLQYGKNIVGPYIISVYKENRLGGVMMGRIEKGNMTFRFGYWKLLRMPVRKIVITAVQSLLDETDQDILQLMISRLIADMRHGVADVAVLDFMPEDSEFNRVLQEMDIPRRMREKNPERWIHRHLNLPASFGEYQRKHRGFMQKVRKFERAFEGRFRYQLFSGVDEIDDFCSAAESISEKTYQRALGVGFLNSPEDRGKMKAAAAQGGWVAYVAYLDEKALAFWSGCRLGSSVFLWWTAYNTYYQDFSPGLVSFARMTELLMSDGVTLIDFGGGDAAYKERLCNQSRWEVKVCLYAPTLRGMLAKCIHSLDAAFSNLIRTRLKGLADRVKTPWRRFIARRLQKRQMQSLAASGGARSTDDAIEKPNTASDNPVESAGNKVEDASDKGTMQGVL